MKTITKETIDGLRLRRSPPARRGSMTTGSPSFRKTPITGCHWSVVLPILLVTSLMYEDLFLLRLRVERLNGEKTYSQHPPTYGHHLLQRPFVDEMDHEAGEYIVTTPFHYVETRQDQQELYAGWARHELVLIDGTLKIQLKRIDLVNCEAAFGNIQLFM